MKVITDFNRICPGCGIVLYYPRKNGLNRAIKENSNCRKCAGLNHRINRDANFKNSELDIISGLLLGDGSLSKPTANAYIKIGCENIEYLEFLTNQISVFKGRKVLQYVDLDGILKNELSSLMYQNITELHNLWYLNRIKIVPQNLILSPITCLHWFLGDGNNGHGEYIKLHTEGFTKIEVDYLVKKLHDLNIMAYPYKRMNPKLFGDGYIIMLGRQPMIKFLEYIGECPVKCFKYKWQLSERFIRRASIKKYDYIDS